MGTGIRYTEEEARALQERLGKHKNKPAAPAVAAAPKAKGPNKHVVRLEQQLAANGFPPHVKEFFAIAGRDFRLDYAWPAHKVGIELQGFHHREKGKYGRDIEKRALHLVAGWRVLELDGRSIKEERSVEWLRALLPHHEGEKR